MRYALLLAVAACSTTPAAPPPRPAAAPIVYGGGLGGWPAVAPDAHLGRGVAPQRALLGTITAAAPLEPLTDTTVTPVHGDGPALAVVQGALGDARATELVDIDRGVIRWRDTTVCTAPVRYADRRAIVCSDERGTVALGLDDHAEKWRSKHRLVLADAAGGLLAAGERLLLAVDLTTGAEAARIALPAPITAASIQARCGAELWAADAGLLRRFDRGGVVWTARVGDVEAIDACDPIVLVLAAPPVAPVAPPPPSVATPAPPRALPPRRLRGRRPVRRGKSPRVQKPAPRTPRFSPEGMPLVAGAVAETGHVVEVRSGPRLALVALARASGRVVGGPLAARAFWRARDTLSAAGAIEIATPGGLEQRPRTLAPGIVWPGMPALGAVLDLRGDRRLVAAPPPLAALDLAGDRATDAIAATELYVLDRDGVRAHLAAAAATAALGEQAIVGGGPTVARALLPAGHPARVPAPPLAAPQPLAQPLDPPPPRALDSAAAIRADAIDLDPVATPVIDPTDGAIVWTLAQRGNGPATIVQLDLRARRFAALADACPPGRAVGVAAGAAAVVCATATGARAVRRDGTRAWELALAAPTGVATAGTAVVVTAGSRALVLDAASGAVIHDHRADDGRRAQVVPVVIGTTTAIATLEHGAIVVRPLGATLASLWSVAPRGTVTGLAADPLVGDLVVALADGDVFRLVARTGASRPVVAGAGRWTPAGDLWLAVTDLELGWAVRATDAGGERFRAAATGPAGTAPRPVAARSRDRDAPVLVVRGEPASVVVLHPGDGRIVDHVALPERAVAAAAFATVVDGAPVGGVLAGGPLTAITF